MPPFSVGMLLGLLLAPTLCAATGADAFGAADGAEGATGAATTAVTASPEKPAAAEGTASDGASAPGPGPPSPRPPPPLPPAPVTLATSALARCPSHCLPACSVGSFCTSSIRQLSSHNTSLVRRCRARSSPSSFDCCGTRGKVMPRRSDCCPAEPGLVPLTDADWAKSACSASPSTSATFSMLILLNTPALASLVVWSDSARRTGPDRATVGGPRSTNAKKIRSSIPSVTVPSLIHRRSNLPGLSMLARRGPRVQTTS